MNRLVGLEGAMTHVSKTNPVRILICEDEGIMAEDIAVSLRSLGYEVVGLVSAGEEAIRIAEETQPDLILMDIKLQGEMQGVTACQRIRSNQDVPVIYISAHDKLDALERVKMSQPYGYLYKPVSAHELKSTVEIALYKHQADKLVKESEERLRSTLDSLHDFVFVLNRGGVFTDFHCPPNLLSKLYVTPDRFIGRHFQDVLPHDVVLLLNDAIILVEQHGSVEHFEYRMFIDSGECFFSAKVSARKALIGNFDGVTIVSRDITDRKRGEEALRESQERYRTIFDGSRDGFVMVDIKGRIIDANKSYCEMLGYSLNELQDLEDFYSITPAHWRQWESKEIWQKRLLRNGYSGVYEKEYIRKDGSVFPVELQSYAVFDESRTPRYLWGVARDITDRKKGMQKLEESEQLYRLLVETTDTGYVVLDERGLVLDANSKYARLTGHASVDEIVGRSVIEWTAEHDKQRNAHEVSLCMSRGVVRNLEIDYVDTEGNHVPIEINGTVSKGRGGNRIITLCREISARKQAEGVLVAQRDLSRALSEVSTLDEAFRLCIKTAMEVSGMEVAGIYVAHQDGSLDLAARSGISETFINKVKHFSKDMPESRITLAGEPVYFSAILPGLSPFISDALQAEGFRASAVIPMSHLGRVHYSLHLCSHSMDDVPLQTRHSLEAIASGTTAALRRIGSEEKLKESEVRRAKAEELAGLHSWTWDLRTGHLLWSPESYRAFGLNQDTKHLTTDTFINSVHEHDRGSVRKALRAALEGEHPYDVEFRIVRPHGEERFLHSRGEIERDATGKTIRMQGMALDITERKRAEKRLRESEEKFRGVFEQCPIGISLASFDRRFLEVNDTFVSILGYSRHELREMTIADVSHPDDLAKEIPLMESLLREEIPAYTCEKRVFRKNGEIAWVSVTVTAIRDVQGNLLYGIGMVHDLTASKLAEQALSQAEQRFQDLYENLRDGMAAVDEGGRIVQCNPQFLRMLGYTFEELTGLTYEDITPSQWHAMESRILEEQVRVKGYSDLYEKEYIHNNGTVFPIEIQTYLATDGSGRLTGYWAFVRDITQRKEAEQFIKASLREKEILLREIHHRVKNNLAVVNSLLRLQSRDAKDPFHREMFEEAQARIRSLALAHERLCQSENLAYVNMNEYLRSLLDHLVFSERPVGSKIAVNQHVENVQLELDSAVPLGFLVNELVSNAAKHAFSNRECGSIDIAFRQIRGEGFELVIKDDGVGLPESVDFDRPRSLGMKLAQLFTKQLHGEIELIRDGGTEFRIRFGERLAPAKE